MKSITCVLFAFLVLGCTTGITTQTSKTSVDGGVKITCTCEGKGSVTKTCPDDGYCDCTGEKPKVVCTKKK